MTLELVLGGGRRLLSPHQLRTELSGVPALHRVVGVHGSAAALLSAWLLCTCKQIVLYVAADTDSCARARDDLEAWLTHFRRQGQAGVLECPAPSPTSRVLELDAPDAAAMFEPFQDRALCLERGATLHAMASLAPNLVVATARALLVRVPPPSVMATGLSLAVADVVDLSVVTSTLESLGYRRVALVEDPGDFAVRGGLVDIWPAGARSPVRAELVADKVDSLRRFSPETQRSLETLEIVAIPPAELRLPNPERNERARLKLQSLADDGDIPTSRARELIERAVTGWKVSPALLPAWYDLVAVTSYLPEGALVVVEDAAMLVASLRAEFEQLERPAGIPHGSLGFGRESLYVAEQELLAGLSRHHVVLCSRSGVATITQQEGLSGLEAVGVDTPTLGTLEVGSWAGALASRKGGEALMDDVVHQMRAWQAEGLDVLIAAHTEHQRERLRGLLEHRGMVEGARLSLEVLPLTRGFIGPTIGIAVVTEEAIFGCCVLVRRERRYAAHLGIDDLRSLRVGDHVVHVEHGIGRYLGIVHKKVDGLAVDLMVIEYEGSDKLYVPVYRLNQVQRFGGEGVSPKLDRLGGVSFAHTKARAKKRARILADQLLSLYAERLECKKQPLPMPEDAYQMLQAAFPHEETADQLAAIEDVLADLRAPEVMDRVVCGDVGFGKTEVAIRAAFLQAMDGRQVAILCPTTVLAQQHFHTFSRRLAAFPLTVKVLSRFQSKSESQKILRGLRQGTVDIVVGTHRLLSKDVQFKRLGMLVVDEEQRFGVSHKERIKQLRREVDVLTLSATPIPRTLQLALGGLRQLSTITSPPEGRRSVRTSVAQFDDELVKSALLRELGRGGQAFFVYNRIDGLYERAERLRALVPEARVAVMHGQMPEAMLEKTMLAFVRGDFDVLVSTAIIENGIDIPRANTIFIDRADLFGLAQLYQLRGRVGRSAQRGYCYLLVPPASKLTEEARIRVEAIEYHVELGSGLEVARLDLELRGGGEFLGAEQSGFIERVGFELYCEMLQEAVRESRGEIVMHDVDPELFFDVEALFPEDYISDVGLRLSLYKRLASAVSDTMVAEIAREVEDRFGRPPREARQLFELMRLKTELRRLRVLVCEASAKSVSLTLSQDTPLDTGLLLGLCAASGGKLRVTPEGRVVRKAVQGERFASGLELTNKTLLELGSAWAVSSADPSI